MCHPSVSYKIMTSALRQPTTPLDSMLMGIYGEHTNLYCIGEYFSSNLVISRHHVFQLHHCTGHFKLCFWSWPWTLIRRCCCTITQLLWTKRYDISAVSLLYLHSDDQVEWNWTFVKFFDSSIYALIHPQAQLALAKITFIINVMLSLPNFVRFVHTASENMKYMLK